uniref:Uncharacterized protein n=1 Tax=Oryza nivara TaxID=4536 RepID=A0A0E0GTH5_ORYNI
MEPGDVPVASDLPVAVKVHLAQVGCPVHADLHEGRAVAAAGIGSGLLLLLVSFLFLLALH